MPRSKVASGDPLLAIFLRDLHRQETRDGLTIATVPTTANELLPHMRLVIKQAMHWENRARMHGISIMDLIQEGYTGLLIAKQKFDSNRGFQFSTYANWWIRAKILRCLDRGHRKGMYLPGWVHEDQRRLDKEIRALTLKLGHDPTTEEILAECMVRLDITRDRAENLIVLRDMHPVSFDNSPDDPDDPGIGRLLPSSAPTPEDESAHSELCRCILANFEHLDEREQMILKHLFGLAGEDVSSAAEVGRQLGITRERVRQIRDHALRTLRSRMRSNDEAQELPRPDLGQTEAGS